MIDIDLPAFIYQASDLNHGIGNTASKWETCFPCAVLHARELWHAVSPYLWHTGSRAHGLSSCASRLSRAMACGILVR